MENTPGGRVIDQLPASTHFQLVVQILGKESPSFFTLHLTFTPSQVQT